MVRTGTPLSNNHSIIPLTSVGPLLIFEVRILVASGNAILFLVKVGKGHEQQSSY
jgi:hypothetical protein